MSLNCEIAEILLSNFDKFLRYWFVINAKRIYIHEWNGFGIGSDLFSVISQEINVNFFVNGEGRGQVFATFVVVGVILYCWQE